MWPENTMLAFDNAHAFGANGFETDLRLSGDGEIILCHDDNLSRFGLPEFTLSQLTTAEIKRIKIKSINGAFEDTIITLRDLLVKYPDKSYIFDCKTSDETLFVTLSHFLKDIDFHDRIWFLTWSAQADAFVRTYFPGYAYFPRESLTRKWGMFSIIGLGQFFTPSHQILSLPAYYHHLPVMKKQQVLSIHQKGRHFVGYIVNTEKEYNRCLACGVQTVLTDRADLIQRLNQSHKET